MSESYRGFTLNEYLDSPWFTRENTLDKRLIDYLLNGIMEKTTVSDLEYTVLPTDRYLEIAVDSEIDYELIWPAATGSGRQITIKSLVQSCDIRIITSTNNQAIDILYDDDNLYIGSLECYTFCDSDVNQWTIISYYGGPPA